MIIITGGAGFIGSNLIKAFNAQGYTHILVVDNLTQGEKIKNLADCEIYDYLDKQTFLELLKNEHPFSNVEAIYHQGACSSTTEWNGQYLMQNNYEYSKTVFHFCLRREIPFYYASSASVYGEGKQFAEKRELELPLNAYGYSKFLFDQYVRRYLGGNSAPIVGLRYFNVYGAREQHKGTMASVAFHFNNQLLNGDYLKLFEGCDGFGDGEQRRDFISVEDVVKVNLWLFENLQVSGIFNVGTGKSQTFNDVAHAVLQWHQTHRNKQGTIQYIPFPAHLKGRYQSFTEADISALRQAGYAETFLTVEQGVMRYLDWLNH